jgi:hypothetical protein
MWDTKIHNDDDHNNNNVMTTTNVNPKKNYTALVATILARV